MALPLRSAVLYLCLPAVALLLASCVSSQITMKKGSLVAERDVPYDQYMETLPLTGGDLAVLRDPDGEGVILERYSDTLGLLWSVAPNIPGGYTLLGGFSFDEDLGRKQVRRVLCFDGTHIGMLYHEDVPGGDSRRTMLRVFDAANGGEIRTLALDSFPAERTHGHRVGGGYLISPDQQRIAVYSFDYDSMIEKEHGKEIRVTVKLFASSGEPQGRATGVISMEGDFYDVEDAQEVMAEPFLDSRGRFCQPVCRGDRSLEIIRFDPSGGPSQILRAFTTTMPKDEDIGIGWVRLRETAAGGLIVGAGMHDDGEFMGVGYARFDPSSSKPAAEWYHAIDDKQAEALVDDDLDDFVLEGMEVGNDGAVVFTLENQEFLTERKDMITYNFYRNRDIITLVFGTDGTLRRAASFTKDQQWLGWGTSLSQILSNDGTSLLLLYPDYERGMLHLADVSLGDSGSVVDNVLAEVGNNNHFVMYEVAWTGSRTIVLPSLSRLSGSGGTRLVKMETP